MSPRYQVGISSLADTSNRLGKKYILESGKDGVRSGDLQFKEYARYLNKALSSKGYSLVTDPSVADLIIIMDYGIGEPKEHVYSYSSPVYGQTGGGSSTTSGFVGGSYFNARTTSSPTYGVVGSQTKVEKHVTYDRYIGIYAYDAKRFIQTQSLDQVWSTMIVSVGSSGDLRRVFPAMLAAALPYMGTNTGKMVVESIGESNDTVKFITMDGSPTAHNQ